jgi:hypothetical protein
MQLTYIYDSTELNHSDVYQINGTLYRWRFKDGSIQHPNYTFSPLPNQRKKADLKLSRNKLFTKVQRVEGMTVKAEVVSTRAVQLLLF